MWPNLEFFADLVTFTEEILNGKFHFLYSYVKLPGIWVLLLFYNIQGKFDKLFFEKGLGELASPSPASLISNKAIIGSEEKDSVKGTGRPGGVL